MVKAARMYNMENIMYLRRFLGNDNVDTFFVIGDHPERGTHKDRDDCEMVRNCLELMEKFNNNRWWLSEDKNVLAYYQLMNPCPLVPFEKFHEALEHLLGRPVWTHEMMYSYERLVAEAERAFYGTRDSVKQRSESINNAFEQLANS